MNSKIRSNVINGDESGSAMDALATAGATQESASQAAAGQPATAPAKTAGTPQHEPAYTPPADSPAVPRDEHHGKGGMYALVGGKRVPADDDGKPKK